MKGHNNYHIFSVEDEREEAFIASERAIRRRLAEQDAGVKNVYDAAAWRRELEKGCCVYFIQAGDGGPIKIGYTSGDPEDRLSELQVGSHEQLKIAGLTSGGRALERELHARFHEYHVRGEWFSPADALVAFIAGAALPPPLPKGDLCEHDWRRSFGRAKYRCAICAASGYKSVKTGKIHTKTSKGVHAK